MFFKKGNIDKMTIKNHISVFIKGVKKLDKEKEELIDEDQPTVIDDGLDIEDFLEEDEEWELYKQKQQKKRSLIVKGIGSLIIIALLISGFQVWFHVFNLPSLQFLQVSNRLSKDEAVQEYRRSVVMVEWGGVKGTGFNIASTGLIVTNEHVVENLNHVNVHFREDGSFLGKVIYTNPKYDLAIIDIEGKDLATLSISPDRNWEKGIGQEMIFIGNPLAHSQIANEGEISGIVQLKDWDIPLMEITAPVYKGNSGSPIIDSKGEVVGVIFATIRNETNDPDVIRAAAIPSYILLDILKNIDEYKE